MMSYLRKYWWILLLILLPFVLNIIIQLDTPTWITHIGGKDGIVGEPKDWLMFWGTYISGICSFVMLLVAWKTLIETKSANRPYIAIRIIKSYGKIYLECRNVGKTTATDVQIVFNKEFIDKIPSNIIKKNMSEISENKFVLPINEPRNFLLLWGELNLSYISMYGGEIKNKSIDFNGEKIEMEESNKVYNYFVNSLNGIIILYNNQYKQKTPANLLDCIDAKQDILKIIACRLEAIENEFKRFNSNNKIT